MRRIKIPLQDFVLKMQGGLMREGGRICGTLRYLDKHTRAESRYVQTCSCTIS